jgi:hypothetical protein
MADTIHLEAYPVNIRKQKIYCVGDINTLDKMYYGLFNIYSEEMLRRHKVVFVFSDIYLKHNPKWLNKIQYDVIFRVKENKDLQLAYTYIQHCSKPLIILWYSNEIPNIIFQNINASKDDITLITGGTFPKHDYTSIFFSTKSTYEEVYNIVSLKKKNIDIKSLVNETKASDVSLVWSSIGESDKQGSLYWIDYNSIKNIVPTINYAQASEYLRNIADVLELKD